MFKPSQVASPLLAPTCIPGNHQVPPDALADHKTSCVNLLGECHYGVQDAPKAPLFVAHRHGCNCHETKPTTFSCMGGRKVPGPHQTYCNEMPWWHRSKKSFGAVCVGFVELHVELGLGWHSGFNVGEVVSSERYPKLIIFKTPSPLKTSWGR